MVGYPMSDSLSAEMPFRSHLVDLHDTRENADEILRRKNDSTQGTKTYWVGPSLWGKCFRKWQISETEGQSRDFFVTPFMENIYTNTLYNYIIYIYTGWWFQPL